MLFLPHGSDETNTLVFSSAFVEISNKIYEPLFRSDFLFGEDKVINFDFINVAIPFCYRHKNTQIRDIVLLSRFYLAKELNISVSKEQLNFP